MRLFWPIHFVISERCESEFNKIWIYKIVLLAVIVTEQMIYPSASDEREVWIKHVRIRREQLKNWIAKIVCETIHRSRQREPLLLVRVWSVVLIVFVRRQQQHQQRTCFTALRIVCFCTKNDGFAGDARILSSFPQNWENVPKYRKRTTRRLQQWPKVSRVLSSPF